VNGRLYDRHKKSSSKAAISRKVYTYSIVFVDVLAIIYSVSGRPSTIINFIGTTHNLEDVTMAWLYLILAGIFEVVWATAMKESNGFTRLVPSSITIIFMLLSFGLLAYAMKTLPLGTAYTIWVGIGAIGAFIAGITLFGEAVNITRVIAAVLIIAGVVLLKLATK